MNIEGTKKPIEEKYKYQRQLNVIMPVVKESRRTSNKKVRNNSNNNNKHKQQAIYNKNKTKLSVISSFAGFGGEEDEHDGHGYALDCSNSRSSTEKSACHEIVRRMIFQ